LNDHSMRGVAAVMPKGLPKQGPVHIWQHLDGGELHSLGDGGSIGGQIPRSHIDCQYCFFLSKGALYPNEKHRMSDATLETYIHQLLESHSASATATRHRLRPSVE
jgi:hypothetical protein